ncbi:ribonuclease P protein component [Bacteroidia bacterium]|nr:ribonuclease P protein component [Bacteroidia bacterium]GHU66921.1 ribonuclease P protein component [Bacteroidia bacterium]
MHSGNTFKKLERISAQREIDLLFNEGSSFIAYPLRVIYLQKQPFSGARSAILISVPKKRLKRAVHRNRIKRLVRESYRLNKHDFIDSISTEGILMAFIYVGNGIASYTEIEAAVLKALRTITAKCHDS